MSKARAIPKIASPDAESQARIYLNMLRLIIDSIPEARHTVQSRYMAMETWGITGVSLPTPFMRCVVPDGGLR